MYPPPIVKDRNAFKWTQATHLSWGLSYFYSSHCVHSIFPPSAKQFSCCVWVLGLTRFLGLPVILASSGAKFGSNSTGTFKPNPDRQVTDSYPFVPVLNSSERDLTVQLGAVVTSIPSALTGLTGGSYHGLKEWFLGDGKTDHLRRVRSVSGLAWMLCLLYLSRKLTQCFRST